jgi:hypothetical protein
VGVRIREEFVGVRWRGFLSRFEHACVPLLSTPKEEVKNKQYEEDQNYSN